MPLAETGVADFLFTQSYRAPLAVESVFQEEKGFSPIKLSLELGGKEYSMSAVTREQACAATNAQCLLTLGSSPLHIGLIPVEQDGVTYYLNKYDPVVGSYINKLNEVAYQGVADAATLTTFAFPKASPITGPVAAGATMMSLYYSDDKVAKGVDIGASWASGRVWGIAARNAGAPLSSDNIRRAESAAQYIGGKTSELIRDGAE